MTDLTRSSFQVHPLYLVTPSLWPISISFNLSAFNFIIFPFSFILYHVLIITPPNTDPSMGDTDNHDRDSDYQEHIVDDSDFGSFSDNPLDRRGSEASIEEPTQGSIVEPSSSRVDTWNNSIRESELEEVPLDSQEVLNPSPQPNETIAETASEIVENAVQIGEIISNIF